MTKVSDLDYCYWQVTPLNGNMLPKRLHVRLVTCEQGTIENSGLGRNIDIRSLCL